MDIPLASLTPPHEGDQMGALWLLWFSLNHPFPNANGQVAEEIPWVMMAVTQAREGGRVHIPPTPGARSATRLFRAFGVKVALEKLEKWIAFKKKAGLWREHF